mmetsp:Transcript_31853/g.50840  ORF Transcript_31853/g.50840 Transcript_31853/m.50840 type:complete len:193 (-) Transcript_31853:296-874(-)
MYRLQIRQISRAVLAEIENTWNNLEQEDWLLIEEKASEWLETDLVAKVNLFPLHILSESLPQYIGYEAAQIDDAVLKAAFWVLGRPAFTVHWERHHTEAYHFDTSIEDPLLTELDVPDLGSGNPRRIFRFQSALAWGRSCNESMNAKSDANDTVPSEVEHVIPKPPSSPLRSSRPNGLRRPQKYLALRMHAK